MTELRLNGYRSMKIRKKERDGPREASSSPVEYHTVECPSCGKFIKKIRKQKEAIKESHASDYESEGRRFESCRAYQAYALIFGLFLYFVFYTTNPQFQLF